MNNIKKKAKEKAKKQIMKYIKARWKSFLAFETSNYDCRNSHPDFPFLLNNKDNGYDILLVFLPENTEDYLIIKITEKLYKKLKKAGVNDLTWKPKKKSK